MDEKAAVEEAVKSRLSLIKYFGDAQIGLRMMLAVMMVTDLSGIPLTKATPGQLSTAAKLRDLHREELIAGPTFVPPVDVCQTLSEMWESYPSTTAYLTDILTPTGFVHFAEPLPDPIPQDGNSMPVAAMSWMVLKADDERVTFFGDGDLDGAYMLMLMIYARTTDLGMDPQENPRVLPVASVVWTIGDEGTMELWKEGLDPNFAQKRQKSPYMQVLLSYFAIIRQELLERGEPKERSKSNEMRLKSARRKHPNLNGKIQVTRFTQQTGSGKVRGSSAGGSGREYSVRFPRRKHWRWQWYEKTQENKPILIITKGLIGPAGAPVVGMERAFLTPKPLGPRPERRS
ncbi:hypothetical protein ACIBCT_35180 [Streptosporangium sp. NPDC050855]|uniref:hypothetical protein n=1 Tax=Streptosporangium sp. NPDC050855 TaxID=3366194 RepID=UPI0037A8D97A